VDVGRCFRQTFLDDQIVADALMIVEVLHRQIHHIVAGGIFGRLVLQLFQAAEQGGIGLVRYLHIRSSFLSMMIAAVYLAALTVAVVAPASSFMCSFFW
jgi:hypothetical protein